MLVMLLIITLIKVKLAYNLKHIEKINFKSITNKQTMMIFISNINIYCVLQTSY